MTSPRLIELLREAAKCFDEASSPFSTEWLSENDVTADECYDLSVAIASAIKLFCYLPKDERMAWQVKQIISESDLPDEQKRYMLASLDFKEAVKKLNNRKGKTNGS